MRWFVFENRDDGVAHGGQMDFFEQPHRAALVNHRFDCSIHGQMIMERREFNNCSFKSVLVGVEVTRLISKKLETPYVVSYNSSSRMTYSRFSADDASNGRTAMAMIKRSFIGVLKRRAENYDAVLDRLQRLVNHNTKSTLSIIINN
jgi:hypothetical protein